MATAVKPKIGTLTGVSTSRENLANLLIEERSRAHALDAYLSVATKKELKDTCFAVCLNDRGECSFSNYPDSWRSRYIFTSNYPGQNGKYLFIYCPLN